MNLEPLIVELMRLIGKNRHLKPQDVDPKDSKDIQTLISTLRTIETPYPHF